MIFDDNFCIWRLEKISTDIKMDFNPIIPITISLIISGIWLTNRSIVIAYGNDFLKEGGKWLSNRPILIPTIVVFCLPTFVAYLTLNQIPDILKFILPLVTFIVGQFIGKYDKQNEIKTKQAEILSTLKRKLSIIRKKIDLNKFILEKEVDLLESPNKTYYETRLQLVDQVIEDFSKFDTSLMWTNDKMDLVKLHETVVIIDEFNELINERREYILKCREINIKSDNLYFDLLESTDRELIKRAKSFEVLMNEVSKIHIKI